MKMSMSLNFGLRQYMECKLCKQPIPHDDDPNSQCPEAICERLAARIRKINCAKCHKFAVDTNENDFLECRLCHTQYCTSSIVAGYDASTLEQVALFDDDQIINAVVLPEKGKGNIRIDIALKLATKQKKEALKNLKKKK